MSIEYNKVPVFLRNSIIKILCTFLLILLFHDTAGQQHPFLRYTDHPWVDSVLASLSEEE